MSEGYFSGDAQILLANGSYKNIAQIKPGDRVINMRNDPVEVTKVHQGVKVSMMEIRYQNWYAPFYCTKDVHCLVMNNTDNEDPQIAELKWVVASDLHQDSLFTSESSIYRTLLPDEFSVPLTTPNKILMLKPTYELGLIFGLYAGYGSITNEKIVFLFGPNDSLVTQVKDLLKNLFDVDATIEKNEYCYQICADSAHLVELFTDFGTKVRRCIPHSYWSANEEYVHGILEGLVEYDPDNNISRYIPVTKNMAEVFLWVCSLVGLTFENDTPRIDKFPMRVYPLFIRHEQDDSYLGKITNVDTSANVELSGWNLEVACPTKSFIVNNLVVRSVSPSEPVQTLKEEQESIEELTNEVIP